MKKTLILLGLWIIAVVLIAILVMSMGFTFPEALFIGVQFLPGALAARYFLSKISFQPRKAGIRDAIFVSLAILVAEIALVAWANLAILHMRKIWLLGYKDYPQTLSNPVFIGMILALLVLAESALSKYLDKRFPPKQQTIRFISDRKSVTLNLDQILYIESNDKEVTIYANDGRHYRNKTGISQWSDILGEGFLRIHRSYLVNTAHATLATPDSVAVDGSNLPVSRKYKDSVHHSLQIDDN